MNEEKLKEYVLKKYKKLFSKKKIIRDQHGKIIRRVIETIDPIITIKETHIEIKNNKDASPIILSKDVQTII
jgi:hypothetical protein|tara:strand:+ start:372 stop:587 length:216 start_codon:yes stop_codon:yes gene_type:complete